MRALAYLLLAGCYHAPATRVADGDEWPNPPYELPPHAPQVLTLDAGSFAGMTAESWMAIGHKQQELTAHVSTTVHYEHGDDPAELRAVIDVADFETGGDGRPTHQHVEHAPQPTTSIRVTPSALTIAGESAVTLMGNAILGLELPATPIAVGATWSRASRYTFPSLGIVEVVIDYRYAADTACPSNLAHACVRIDVRGRSKSDTTPTGSLLTGAERGRIYFDVDARRPDSMRRKLAYNFENRAGEVFELDATVRGTWR